MTRIIAMSDQHYGLKSAGVDRTNEIHGICKEIVQHALLSRADYLVSLGDLGHRSSPSPEVYAKWVELWEKLERQHMKSYFMLGNHDVVNDKSRPYGSLAPLQELDYDFVKLAENWSVVDFYDGWRGIFLPYFNQAYIGSRHNEYYEAVVNEVLDGLDEDKKLIVFTHLNIDNAVLGEDKIYRPVNAIIPQRLLEDVRVKLIVSGHIHKPQELNNGKLVVVGSPFCTDFGDIDDKSYLDIEIEGNEVTYKRIPTNHIKLLQLDYDLVEGHELNFIKSSVQDAGVKVNIRGTKDQINSINLIDFENDIKKYAKFVRPICPIIVRINQEKKSILEEGMTDKDLVEKWIDTRKPSNDVGILTTAMDILEEAG